MAYCYVSRGKNFLIDWLIEFLWKKTFTFHRKDGDQKQNIHDKRQVNQVNKNQTAFHSSVSNQRN